ncbi:MAG: hypothetical protein KDC56_09735, partial [Flavobacteriaceae bacterium]|nr:hypothetical protein [Flavobacteriaceae bacterium]
MLSKHSYLYFLLIITLLISCKQTTEKQDETKTAYINLEEITIAQLQKGYTDGEFTIADVVQNYLNKIDSIDAHGPELHAVIQVNPDALSIARQLDEELKQGKTRGPLHGIP